MGHGSRVMGNGSWVMSHALIHSLPMSLEKKFMKQTKYTPKSRKARKLAHLMTEEQKQNAGILDLSFDFACRITRLYQYLTEDSSDKEFVMSKQVYRSGTSIGANARGQARPVRCRLFEQIQYFVQRSRRDRLLAQSTSCQWLSHR